MPRIDLFGSQEKGLSVAINDQRSINCYVVPSPRGRNGVAMVGAMGSTVFSETSGEVRGCRTLGNYAYFVIGTILYRINTSGQSFSLGTVPGTGLVSIVDDGTSVIVVNGTTTGYYYNTSASTFSAITFPYAAYTVTYIDTYLAFSSDGQRFFISNVGDSDAFDALDFASEIKSPDDLLTIIEDHGELILFGAGTIVPWFNSGDVDFPFSQNTSGIIERGLYARFSVAKEDNTVIFLGDDLIVYRLNGYQPVRISNDSSEILLSNLIRDGFESSVRNAYALIYTEHGHKFYQLTIPNLITLTFNLATGEWHQSQHWSYNTHHAVCYCKLDGKHLIGCLDGKVYEMSRAYYADGDQPLVNLRRSSCYSIEGKLISWKKIKLEFDFGSTPVLTGQGSSPTVMLRWSHDYGRTFRSQRALSLGVSGDYLAKAIARNCGSSRHRVYEFYNADPVPFFLVDAFAEFR